MKKLLMIILIALLCGGCGVQELDNEPTMIETVPSMQATTVPTEVAALTEGPIETEADYTISVSAGSYCRMYTDSETGEYLDYYLFVPENAVKNMPLIVFLHGDGEVGNVDVLENFGLMSSAREIYGNEFPFIAISPSTREYSWINGMIPSTLKGLIDEIVSECEIDIEHIIITGHSRGAIGTWHMVSTYGDFFSAAVPVSGDSEGMLDYDHLTAVPIWAVAGSHDVYYLDNMKVLVNMITQAGGDAKLTILEGLYHGETSTKAYTEEMFEWMCAQ